LIQVVLVQRLYQHQQKGSIPDDTDLQMALSRCWLHGTENAIQMAMEKLQGELRELMLFLLDKDQHPTGPFTMEAAWMIAALSKSPATIYPELQGLFYSQKPRQLYTGQYPYQIQVETYTYQDHHWENGKLFTSPKGRSAQGYPFGPLSPTGAKAQRSFRPEEVL
jgi:hypothetical protein